MSEAPQRDEALPRRDFFLLPLVALGTVLVMLGGAEAAARVMFAERGEFTCGDPKTPGAPNHQTPNCVTSVKSAEGPEVEYRFNECGFRSTAACGAKPAGTLRVVLIGTSITMGYQVPNEETFAVRTERALRQVCGRPVEVQNMGAMTSLEAQEGIAGEALALSPDVIVLTLVPYDIEDHSAAPPSAKKAEPTWPQRLDEAWNTLRWKLRDVKFQYAAAHFMLSQKRILYKTFLNMGPSRDIMSSPLTAAGERRYAAFAKVLDGVMARLKGTGVPLLVVAVPNRISAAMVNDDARIEGVDPRLFGRYVSQITRQRGALALDTTGEFAASACAEQLFYVVDNHPTGGGHAVIARALAKRLTDGSIPQLAACRLARPGGR